MGDFVDVLRSHRRIGIDTPIFIYHIEQAPPWAPAAGRVLRSLADGEFLGVTSALSLMELAPRPLQMGRPEAADAYATLVQRINNLDVVGIDLRTSRIGAELRAKYRIRTPDALQIAACVANGASAFLTDDRRLKQVQEIEVIVLDELMVHSEMKGCLRSKRSRVRVTPGMPDSSSLHP